MIFLHNLTFALAFEKEVGTHNHWRDGRVVDYNGLENRRTERYRGFESLSLRNLAWLSSIYKHCTRICTRKRPILTLSGVFYAHFSPDFILFCTRPGKMYTTGQNVHDQGFNAFFLVIEDSLKNDWRIIEDSLKNRQGLKERPFVFDTFWPGKVKTSITFDGIWPLLSIFWPLFDARHQISVKSWSQNERFLVKTWWFLTSERKLLQVSSNFQIENQTFATIERKLPELSSKFLPGFAA